MSNSQAPAMTAWKTKPLGELFKVVGGGTPSKKNSSYYGGNIPWATIRDMHSGTLTKTEHTITEQGLQASSAKLIPAGEVIMASRVGLGKACLLHQDTAINQDIRALIPRDTDGINRRFCLYWLQTQVDAIIDAGSGATVQGIKLPFIKSLPFPDICVDEQDRIVAVLDQAFAALDRARALVGANMADAEELFDNMVQAAIDELENRHGTRALEDHVEFKNGFAFKSAKFTPDGEPVARISNIQGGGVDLTKVVFTRREDYSEDLSKYEIHPDELLIAMSGATTGKIGFNRTDKVLLQNQRVGRFTTKSKINLEYLAYFLETKVEEHLSISAGAAQPNLSTKQIREIVLPIPDDQGQMDFVMRMEKMRARVQAARASYTAQLSDLDDLRQSLLQKAFAGELT